MTREIYIYINVNVKFRKLPNKITKIPRPVKNAVLYLQKASFL